MTQPKGCKPTTYLDLGAMDVPSLGGQSMSLVATECSVCHQLSATLIGGKCPKHADVQPAQPDLLGTGDGGKKDKKGGCWTRRGK